MTTQNIIAALYRIAQDCEGYDDRLFKAAIHSRDTYDTTMPQIFQMAGLIRELEDDMRKQTAKSTGKSQALSAAKRILAENATRKKLLYPWNDNEKQYIMNGHILVCLVGDSRLPLEEMPEELIPPNGASPFNHEYILDTYKGENNPMELPDLASLKTYIKIENAKRKGQKFKRAIRYDFGFYDGMIDAQYLADVMEIMPGARCYMNTPMYFTFYDDKGNRAMICGIRRKEKEPIQRTQL